MEDAVSEIRLFARVSLGNGTADSYVLCEQTPHISVGRSCHGGSEWLISHAPSAGASKGICTGECIPDFNNDGTLDIFDVFAIHAGCQ